MLGITTCSLVYSIGELDSYQEISDMYGLENVISLGIYKPGLISTVK